MNYLIDTNVILELVKKTPNIKVLNWFKKTPDECLYISILTFGEIRKGIEMLDSTKCKEQLRAWLEHELPNWFGERVKEIDVGVADRWGRLQAEMERPAPVIDSLLAATALHSDMAIVTRNITDFQFPQLQTINPWD